jgi:hypothetical protein
MRTTLTAALSIAILSMATITGVSAQNAILAQMYGKGVHAYYAGNSTAAREYLSMAINGGSNDPRAYYFRGLVAYAQGNTYEAESDWQQGARLEAQGKSNPFIGRSLIRFQGTGRLKLEEIRQKARLEYATIQAARSNQRIQEINNSAIRNRVINPPVTPPPPSVIPSDAVPPAASRPATGAPAAPPEATDPFADNLAEGEASVTKEDALEGAMEDPFADEPATAADGEAPAAEDNADPFADADGDDGGDLFEGGDDAAPSDGADPFGEDPFAE